MAFPAQFIVQNIIIFKVRNLFPSCKHEEWGMRHEASLDRVQKAQLWALSVNCMPSGISLISAAEWRCTQSTKAGAAVASSYRIADTEGIPHLSFNRDNVRNVFTHSLEPQPPFVVKVRGIELATNHPNLSFTICFHLPMPSARLILRDLLNFCHNDFFYWDYIHLASHGQMIWMFMRNSKNLQPSEVKGK